MKFNKDWLAVIIILIFGIIFWNVMFKSSIVFGDEGYWGYIAKYTAENNIYPKTEVFRDSDIYQSNLSKQPMFIFLEAFFWLFGENAVKFMIPMLSILTAMMIYILLKSAGKQDVGIVASILFLTAPAMITYSVLNYSESLLMLFLVCAVYFSYMAFETDKKEFTYLAGIFAGMSMLTKSTGPIIIFFFLLYPVITKQWKNKAVMKKALTMIMIGAVLVAPFIIRNFILYNDLCYSPVFTSLKCMETVLQVAPDLGVEFAGRTAASTAESGISSVGVMTYSSFAYNWIFLILAIFGIFSAAMNRDKINKAMLLLFLMTIPLFIYLKDVRIEDLSRWTLMILIPMSVLAANFLSDFYEWTKKKGKFTGIIIIIVILSFSFYLTYEKANSLIAIKTFPAGFTDACNWVRATTPKDSLLLSIYAQQTAYACDRATTTSPTDMAEILLTNDDEISYKHLKLNGYDYIFVMHNLISQIPYEEAFPYDFLLYIQNSDKYEKVYDNTNTYGNNGVSIYKIL